MTSELILRIAVPAPLRQCFDYRLPTNVEIDQLKPGIRIKVPFQRRELIGILQAVEKLKEKPNYPLKEILQVLDREPVITSDCMKLALWAADYYQAPIGEVFYAALPALLRKGKEAVLSKMKGEKIAAQRSPKTILLNQSQLVAKQLIEKANDQFQVTLLEGVTGSGKTEVYLESMAALIQDNKQVLVIVPEIGLTPQTIQRFRERFDCPIVALHSGLTERERLNGWCLAKEGIANIVIGTRSAVFTPFANLGLIIIDEEHDLSLKQQEGFRYHARDLSVMRAHFNQIPIVLGSATPSLESIHNADQNRYQRIFLPYRANEAKAPQFEVLDIRKKKLNHGLSDELIHRIQTHLDRHEQVMLFLNRRGYSPVIMCHGCGWMAICQRCDTRMTYHHQLSQLQCHRCEAKREMIKRCEQCYEKALLPIGHGTERLEIALQAHFPKASIARLDRDSTRKKGSLESVIQGMQSGEHHILIGTQMIAKGHHFPNVTLVALVDADGGFFSSDFRALERMGQLLLQVAGRAGRDEKEGTVLIQTRHPDHPLLHLLMKEGYTEFANHLLKERLETHLPPYSFLALLSAEAHQLKNCLKFLEVVKKTVTGNNNIQVAGPFPAPHARRKGYHRAQLLFQAKTRTLLHPFLKNLLPLIDKNPAKPTVRWSLEVDPLELT